MYKEHSSQPINIRNYYRYYESELVLPIRSSMNSTTVEPLIYTVVFLTLDQTTKVLTHFIELTFYEINMPFELMFEASTELDPTLLNSIPVGVWFIILSMTLVPG